MRMRSANFDDISMLRNSNNTTLSSRDGLTSASLPPLSSHPLHTASPPRPVWGEWASKGWCRTTQHLTMAASFSSPASIAKEG